MGIALASRRIAGIVADAKPRVVDVVVAPAFVESKGGGGEAALLSRSFFFEVREMRRLGQTRATFVAAVGVVVVDYKDHKNRAALAAAIGDDYEVITAGLADQAQWRTSESTIRVLGADSETQPGAPLFGAVVDDVVVGGNVAGRRLRITFPFEVIA